jgi:hypothetical protein
MILFLMAVVAMACPEPYAHDLQQRIYYNDFDAACLPALIQIGRTAAAIEAIRKLDLDLTPVITDAS